MAIDRVAAAYPSLPAWAKAAIDSIIDGAMSRRPSDRPMLGYLSASFIAAANDVNVFVLRRHLKNWRATNPKPDEFIEVVKPGPRDPKHLYRPDAVAPLVEKLTKSRVRRQVR